MKLEHVARQKGKIVASSFDKEVKKNFKLLQKKVVKILKNLKNPGLDYAIAFSVDAMHPERVNYTVWIQPPANKLARPEWVATDFDDLAKQLDAYIAKEVSDVDVQIAYHGAQIKACEESIDFHKKEIADLKQGEEDEEENVSA